MSCERRAASNSDLTCSQLAAHRSLLTCRSRKNGGTLLPRIPRHSHHRRSQQPVFQLISTLQFLEDLVIFGIFCVDHFDGFVIARIELLALSRDLLYSELRQRIDQLLVNEFNAVVEL